ncbi:S-adenosyl-L-methionine-dependent methyltransferase [Gloeopeniophorella convolvens]|nr:S-adenosyl-L-methionine-dependent methyltransferase [Gloeopeniophorella convolvens]
MFPPPPPRRPSSPPPSAAPDPDAPVRATDTDAALARLSAVRRGYLADPYIAPLVPRAHLQPARPPLINIGTYLRARTLDALVAGFVRAAAPARVQIVSLGAGSDTRFWRLAEGPDRERIARYVELDFKENTARKVMAIRKSAVLGAPLGEVSVEDGGTALRAPVYSLLPADLRRAPPWHARLAELLDPATPTLLLAECVLVYMPPAAARALLAWFAAHVERAPLGAAVYEMFGLGDAFGRVMRANLRVRGVELPGAEPYADVEALRARFTRELGWARGRAVTLREVRARYVAPRERARLAGLEMLDEVEELELVLAHYAVSWGVREAPDGAGAGLGAWELDEADEAEGGEDGEEQSESWAGWVVVSMEAGV